MKITFPHQKRISAQVLAGMAGATFCGNDTTVSGICTDSREADADTAFVAMVGERVDGHDFIAAAIASGCRCVIGMREVPRPADIAFLCVPDSEAALSKLAASHLSQLSARRVAVTGSVGKTTTKDMIAAVLGARHRIYATKGNYNSVIGMPLSALEVSDDCEFVVFEMGMSGRGEIRRMSHAARPHMAVITNIGTSHMEMLGSREGIRDAKLEISEGLVPGGTLFLNGDDAYLANISGKTYRTQYISILREDADFSAQNIRVDPMGTAFDVRWSGGICRDLRVSVAGRHNVYAALYAFAVGIHAGLTPEEICTGLSRFQSAGLRQTQLEREGMTFLVDCYNASPESMRAAIETLKTLADAQERRSVAILGDMLELGTGSEELHRAVGAAVTAHRIDRLIAVGHGGRAIAKGAREAGMSAEAILSLDGIEEVDRTRACLDQVLRARDLVLVKASRSMRLERILELFENP